MLKRLEVGSPPIARLAAVVHAGRYMPMVLVSLERSNWGGSLETTPLTTHHAGKATNEPTSLVSVETLDTTSTTKSNIESLIHRRVRIGPVQLWPILSRCFWEAGCYKAFGSVARGEEVAGLGVHGSDGARRSLVPLLVHA